MVPQDLPRSLLIPVETTNREFDGKLLLALKALERGYEPVIGSRSAMHAILPSLPLSIYLAKGTRIGSEKIFALLDALGHVIVALDEEALVRFPDEAFHMKLDPKTFNRPRLLYAWGKSNADAWRNFKDFSGAPILETGNPRVDMMRPEIRAFYQDDCEALRKEFGRFVLVSSNFSFVNHFIPGHDRLGMRKTADGAKSRAVKSGAIGHKQILFEKFLLLVPQLARAIAPHTLLIRPHPSENASRWQEAAQGLPNVRVVHSGPMTPWLMAADALIHNGCTSGIEAAILGTPAYAYRPHRSSFDFDLPHSVSTEFEDSGALIDACRARLSRDFENGSGASAEQAAALEDHIASLAGSLSSDRILDSFQVHGELLAARRPRGIRGRIDVIKYHYARRAYRAALTHIKLRTDTSAYKKHKFPDMTLDQIRRKAATLESLLGHSPADVTELHPNVFALRRSAG